jgi:hypothetical protein
VARLIDTHVDDAYGRFDPPVAALETLNGTCGRRQRASRACGIFEASSRNAWAQLPRPRARDERALHRLVAERLLDYRAESGPGSSQ